MVNKVLTVSNLVVNYGNIRVLDGISLDVYESEILGLAGSNGSGKSTLMNAIAGIKNTEAGAIDFLGKDIMNLAPRDRRKLGMALVPQEDNLFPQMSVGKNLDVVTHLLEKRERRERDEG